MKGGERVRALIGCEKGTMAQNFSSHLSSVRLMPKRKEKKIRETGKDAKVKVQRKRKSLQIGKD